MVKRRRTQLLVGIADRAGVGGEAPDPIGGYPVPCSCSRLMRMALRFARLGIFL